MSDTIIDVRVTPRARQDEVAGWQEGVLRVRLRAPPVEGQANEALLKLLAGRLGLRPSDVQLASGAVSRSKRVRVLGLSEDEVRSRLG